MLSKRLWAVPAMAGVCLISLVACSTPTPETPASKLATSFESAYSHYQQSLPGMNLPQTPTPKASFGDGLIVYQGIPGLFQADTPEGYCLQISDGFKEGDFTKSLPKAIKQPVLPKELTGRTLMLFPGTCDQANGKTPWTTLSTLGDNLGFTVGGNLSKALLYTASQTGNGNFLKWTKLPKDGKVDLPALGDVSVTRGPTDMILFLNATDKSGSKGCLSLSVSPSSKDQYLPWVQSASCEEGFLGAQEYSQSLMQGPLAQAVNDYRALELKAHIIGSNLAKRTDSSKALLKAMLDLRMGVKTLTESNKGNGYTLTVDSVSKPTRLAVSRSGYCFEGTFKDLKSLTESQTLTGFQGEAQPGGVCPS